MPRSVPVAAAEDRPALQERTLGRGRATRAWLALPGAALAAWLVAGPAMGQPAAAAAATTAKTAPAGPPAAPPLHGPKPGHGPGPGRPPLGGPASGPGLGGPGLSGTVATLSGSGFGLTVAGTTYQVATTSATRFLLAPGWATTQAALTVGEHVSVQGTVSGEAVAARTIGLRASGIRAKVDGVSGDTVSVTQPSGRTATLRFAASPALTAGQTVEAVGTWQGDTLAVTAWRVPPAHVAGVVRSVSSPSNSEGSASVQTVGGQLVTIHWSSATRFAASPRSAAGPSLVTVGSRLQAEGDESGSVLQATRIELAPTPPQPQKP